MLALAVLIRSKKAEQLKFYLPKKATNRDHPIDPFPQVHRAATRISWLSGKESLQLMIRSQVVTLVVVLI